MGKTAGDAAKTQYTVITVFDGLDRTSDARHARITADEM
jgi:hypothetical protein